MNIKGGRLVGAIRGWRRASESFPLFHVKQDQRISRIVPSLLSPQLNPKTSGVRIRFQQSVYLRHQLTVVGLWLLYKSFAGILPLDEPAFGGCGNRTRISWLASILPLDD